MSIFIELVSAAFTLPGRGGPDRAQYWHATRELTLGGWVHWAPPWCGFCSGFPSSRCCLAVVLGWQHATLPAVNRDFLLWTVLGAATQIGGAPP